MIYAVLHDLQIIMIRVINLSTTTRYMSLRGFLEIVDHLKEVVLKKVLDNNGLIIRYFKTLPQVKVRNKKVFAMKISFEFVLWVYGKTEPIIPIVYF